MNTVRSLNAWIPYRRPSYKSRLRLFCFPYAGGSASVFREWIDSFPAGIDVCPIQYPGREKRITEPPFTLVEPLIDALVNGLSPEFNIPFAFWGHSLGALISFELARRLQKRGVYPVHLFISGYCAPVIAKRKFPMHLLPDVEFVERLRAYHGTPEVVLNNNELMRVLLPTLRADFALHETYVYPSAAPLNCPISAYGGIKDPEVYYHDLELWKMQTIQNFKLQMFPGDHFYIHSCRRQLVNSIINDLILDYRKSSLEQEGINTGTWI
ncbi:medium-chain acyl-[acyl-carrier-protein] hydrolase [Sporomusaceae bacterium BoRhaA]|uniref:thioesterase II family protein n=1 Tax=Pelorhabdus rhamnosifermentans TaxID=2772457 RepID=UPI001C062DA3|nr:thioesterase domain-containing protein [Pelorhabdus rhamnosifermentans]MBU2703326.1 medium-chain acyl-[acyl-carrier-protein] hydrolase [Pelorhabdus rhamnosifermentans]